MFKLDPTQDRQLPGDGPLALWRDQPGGGREGLVMFFQACPNPTCQCSDVLLVGWHVDEKCRGAEINDRGRLDFDVKEGGREEREVLRALVHLDRSAAVSEGSDSAPSEPWAMEWLLNDLKGPLLPALEARLAAFKRGLRPSHDWRADDWSWWEPGQVVCWLDIEPEEDESNDFELDGAQWLVSDLYCVEPGCDCEEVYLQFSRDHEDPEKVESIGGVAVNPAVLSAAQFDAHGPNRSLLKHLWAEWCEEFDTETILKNRSEEMKRIAPEIHRLFGKRRPVQSEHPPAGPNDRCPCGSGKKFKRCCMNKPVH